MRRIGLAVVLALGLFLEPRGVEAQRSNQVPRIGYLVLSPLVDPPTAERAAFLDGLRELGYVEGQSISIEYRSAEWNRGLLPDLAKELVDLKVDVIVAVPGAIDAARQATRTIPIVVPAELGPVEAGLAASLARPGGNITGTAAASADMAGKRLELLKQALPKVSHVGVLWNPSNPGSPREWKETEAAARVLKVALQSFEARDPKEFPDALAEIQRKRPGALITLISPLMMAYRPIIVEFAMKNRLPTIFSQSVDAEGGGLLSYGPNVPEMFRRTASYVDRILKGAKPADLPVEQPTQFELVINLKTAKALGLTIPQSVLLRADRVIE